LRRKEKVLNAPKYFGTDGKFVGKVFWLTAAITPRVFTALQFGWAAKGPGFLFKKKTD